jgi:F-type H+-transporting ATPase subunit epsilon
MADDSLFDVQLVTPERILVSGPASEVILRTGDGDASFLAGHTPLVGTVQPGVLRVIRPEGQVELVAVHGGFVQVEKRLVDDDGPGGSPAPVLTGGTRVTLLIGVAELAEEIDAARSRAALEAAEARVAELGGAGGRSSSSGSGAGEGDEPDADLVEAEAALLRAQVRLEAVDASAGVTVSASTASA